MLSEGEFIKRIRGTTQTTNLFYLKIYLAETFSRLDRTFTIRVKILTQQVGEQLEEMIKHLYDI